MKLTEEKAPFKLIQTKKPTIVENAKGDSVMRIEGIFGKVDARNENNRRYPRRVFEPILSESSTFMQLLRSRSILGELEHPESGNTHLERVSHLITDVRLEHIPASNPYNVPEGDYILGSYEILNTPRGKILQALHEAKVSIGVSSRGQGDVRNVDGIDEVQEGYELDTFDVVYRPSVIEARPSVVTEAEDLGSSLPNAIETEPSVSTEPSMTTNVSSDWKPEADEIIRALESTLTRKIDSIEDLVKELPRGINLIDQLSSLDDEEAVKLRGQATSLIRMISDKIMNMSTKKEKAESIIEDLSNLASTIADKRKKEGKSNEEITGLEIEVLLKQAGHQGSDDEKQKLKAQLRQSGLKVQEAKDTTKECIVDGEVVLVPIKSLITNDPVVEKWLEDQEDSSIPARIGSHGTTGCVVNLVDSSLAQGAEFFIELNKIQKIKAETENDKRIIKTTEKMEDSMKSEDIIAGLVARNKELKKQLEAKVPKSTVKESKIKGYIKNESVVSRVRYDAAKKLISGLVERVKVSEQKALKESNRVKASVKIIHKLVQEAKDKKTNTSTIRESKEKILDKKENNDVKSKLHESSARLRRKLRETKAKSVSISENSNLMQATSKRLHS